MLTFTYICSYLVAIVVANLVVTALGPWSTLYDTPYYRKPYVAPTQMSMF